MSLENGKPFTIDVNGKQEDVEPDNGKDFKSDQLHELCKCDMIQIVYVDKSMIPAGNKHLWIIVLDEEGKLKPNAQVNEIASLLYRNPYDLIVGKVLVCLSSMVK